jgi:hypothetical protein
MGKNKARQRQDAATGRADGTACEFTGKREWEWEWEWAREWVGRWCGRVGIVGGRVAGSAGACRTGRGLAGLAGLASTNSTSSQLAFTKCVMPSDCIVASGGASHQPERVIVAACRLFVASCIVHIRSHATHRRQPPRCSSITPYPITHHLTKPSHLARRRLLCRLATRLAGSGGGLTRPWCKCCVPLAHKPPTASHAALNPHGSLLQPPAISHIFTCAAPALPAGLPCSLTRSFPPPPPITLLVPT